ncbi:MAG: hypothetical protein IJ716_14325 [Lachnospiraceae bacterium]|nr:hypothetical protein [Lachnospiraceae bacterium]
MSRMTWDKVGERFFETGVDHGVLFTMKNDGTYNKGVNWDGLTSVNESSEGGEANDIYADNIKYLSLMSSEQFNPSIGAYQSPEEFDECDGAAALSKGVYAGQQTRKGFGLSYRSKIGNDVEGDDYGYKLHLVYNAKCSPSEKDRSTVNENPEATELSWDINTTPVSVSAINPSTGKPYKPTAHIWIDSTRVDADKLAAFEDILYGTDGGDSYDAVTPEGTENPSTEGWYELSGTTYVLSTDTTVDTEKTYYEKTTSAGTDSTLPSPDEVYAFFNS